MSDIDNWLEAAYEDRFYIEMTDEDDGFVFGWEDGDDDDAE